MRDEGGRRAEVFVPVPKSDAEDVAVTVPPAGNGTYSMSPFPFAGDRLEARCAGRYFTPLSADETPDDLAAALYGLPEEEQVHILVAG